MIFLNISAIQNAFRINKDGLYCDKDNDLSLKEHLDKIEFKNFPFNQPAGFIEKTKKGKA